LYKTELFFQAPFQVDTLDVSLNKQSTSSGAASIGGGSYEVLHSQAQNRVFRVYSFFQKYVSKDEQNT
jgi:hypothetical protein